MRILIEDGDEKHVIEGAENFFGAALMNTTTSYKAVNIVAIGNPTESDCMSLIGGQITSLCNSLLDSGVDLDKIIELMTLLVIDSVRRVDNQEVIKTKMNAEKETT